MSVCSVAEPRTQPWRNKAEGEVVSREEEFAIVVCLLFFFFKEEFLCVALAVLELPL